jgi:hypothetical protein
MDFCAKSVFDPYSVAVPVARAVAEITAVTP